MSNMERGNNPASAAPVPRSLRLPTPQCIVGLHNMQGAQPRPGVPRMPAVPPRGPGANLQAQIRMCGPHCQPSPCRAQQAPPRMPTLYHIPQQSRQAAAAAMQQQQRLGTPYRVVGTARLPGQPRMPTVFQAPRAAPGGIRMQMIRVQAPLCVQGAQRVQGPRGMPGPYSPLK